VESIRSFVQLKDSARKLGLEKTEDKARAWIPRRGAL
jgi:hypothetical protein